MIILKNFLENYNIYIIKLFLERPMKIKRKTLNKIIFGLLYEAKNFNNKKTSEIEFDWGKYEGKHADEDYMIADDKSSLGDGQRPGDPFTYERLDGDKIKVVSAPASLAKSIGATLEKKDFDKKDSDKNKKESPDAFGEEDVHEEILNFDNLDEINDLIDDLRDLISDLKQDQGKNLIDGNKVEITVAGKTGIKNFEDYKKGIGMDPIDVKYFTLTSSAKEFNEKRSRLRQLHSDMILEYFTKMNKFVNDRFDDSNYPTSAPLNFITIFLKSLAKVASSQEDRLSRYMDSLQKMNSNLKQLEEGTLFTTLSRNYATAYNLANLKSPGPDVSDELVTLGSDIAEDTKIFK